VFKYKIRQIRCFCVLIKIINLFIRSKMLSIFKLMLISSFYFYILVPNKLDCYFSRCLDLEYWAQFCHKIFVKFPLWWLHVKMIVSIFHVLFQVSNNFSKYKVSYIFLSLVLILNSYVLWHERHEMHKLWMNLRLSILCVSILIYRFLSFYLLLHKSAIYYAYTCEDACRSPVFSSYGRGITIRACRAIS